MRGCWRNKRNACVVHSHVFDTCVVVSLRNIDFLGLPAWLACLHGLPGLASVQFASAAILSQSGDLLNIRPPRRFRGSFPISRTHMQAPMDRRDECAQAQSLLPLVQATAIWTSTSATAKASVSTSGGESVTEMACEDLQIYEDPDLAASSFGSVAPEHLSHKAADDIRHDGLVPGFVELVVDARVFNNCKSWRKRYQAKKNDVFVPLCTPKEYNGYDMLPVLGGGAIQADLARPYPETHLLARRVSSIYQVP